MITKQEKNIIIGVGSALTITALTALILWKKRKVEPVPNARLSSGYGYRVHPITGEKKSFHNGLDLSAPAGTKIRTILSGVVERIGYDNVNGYFVKIKHKNWSSFYGHMLKPALVKVGQKVVKGQDIGLVGSTGMSTGPHVHFIIYDKTGKHVDPIKTGLLKKIKNNG